MNPRLIPFVVLAAFLLPACEESGDRGPDHSAEQKALNENRALWERSNITSYRYTYRTQCYCLVEDVVVVVVNRQVTEAFRVLNGTYLTPQERMRLFPIEGMFDRAQEAINERAFSLQVTYNAQYGYPQSVAIDRSQNLVDDEITYTARDFQ